MRAEVFDTKLSTNVRKANRRSIAHTLVVELLAHQFAFPVRWIETQHGLFSQSDAIARFIELGPAKVLTGMAKRTVEQSFAEKDTSLGIERQFLSVSQEAKEIYYEYESSAPQGSEITSQNDQRDIVQVGESQQPMQSALGMSLEEKISEASQVVLPKILDVPITATEIIESLIAHKLKKGLEGVSANRSIKELSGGKSTLQNEIIGDLGAEFGHLPDSVEDLPISTLSEVLQSNFSGQLGKLSLGLIAKFISTRMPTGFNQNAVRKYLDDDWGLGSSRQSGVLLFAITSEPTSRIQLADDAKQYFDLLISRYAKSCGIVLTRTASSPVNSQQDTALVVNSSYVDKFIKEQRELSVQQLNALAKHLKLDLSCRGRASESEIVQADSHEKLDIWYSEFSAEFETGITSLFDAKKGRRYNSWWNLVRQDVISLYHEAEIGRVSGDSANLDMTFLHITNRSNESVSTLLRSLLYLASDVHGSEFSTVGCKLGELITDALHTPPVFKYTSSLTGPLTNVSSAGVIEYKEVLRSNCASYLELLWRGQLLQPSIDRKVPYIHIKRRHGTQWKFDSQMTKSLLDSVLIGIESGISFVGRNILVTGAGPGSIAIEVVRGLLMGGARVILCTSRPTSKTSRFYQNIYSETGARGSELLVLPFNQGSSLDCKALIDHIYSDSGLRLNLDAIIPFAAVSETGTEIDELGAKSELAHRLMMVNVLRLLGHIVRFKRDHQMNTRPTQVLLPLSPNHGTFGCDGLYSESKLGLEGLLNRFHSEHWSEFLSICGVVIGWTRGTGLMNGNDIVAQAIESQDVMTFSQKEMAFNILALMQPEIIEINETQPLWANLDGGLNLLTNLNTLLSEARSELISRSQIRKAIMEEDAREESILSGSSNTPLPTSLRGNFKRRSTLRVGFPTLPDFEKDIAPLNHLQSMVDPSSTVVLVGFSELGPWGSSRTRWEMESGGKLSTEGYIEMAWMMNLITTSDGSWVDAKTGEFVHDSDVPERYGRHILEHSGIRIIEPELCNNYDPTRKEYLHEVSIEEELPEFEATQATAEAFKRRHGDRVIIRQSGGTDEYRVKIKQGATILIPKAIPFDSTVAGQLPTGWDPSKYGIPEDLHHQLDPVTLYSLCCAAEALYSAGIIESLEIFKYIHCSEFGNFIGSCIGGSTKTRQMYKDIYLDKPVQGDIIQETFMCVTAAWINMLLLGASGPIKTPNGTCATGVESLDSACESIATGKTKICFVGGFDDFQEDESYGFGSMKATVNTTEEFAKGRTPSEMSRPTTETRAGFVESHGCGLQIVTTAELALEMGLPIYGVVATSTMAADKIGRSVPAPGQGVLSFARESPHAAVSPLLSIEFRREQMQSSIAGIYRWQSASLKQLSGTGMLAPSSECSHESNESDSPLSVLESTIHAAASCRIKAVQRLWGNEFRKQDPEISPLRASLAVWGLTVDDIDIVSLHATSTKANDKNEAEVVNKQMSHLGRTPGRPLLAICQKSLTGHPKGPASSWMLNGCLQAMNSGTVPGNRNADNVDEALRKFEHLVFPTRTIQTSGIKAFLLNSFGFGQKGGQVVGVHPKYFFATLKKDEFDEYATKVTQRKRVANRAYILAVLTSTVFKAKTSPPYHDDDESTVLMDPLARLTEDKSTFRFDKSNLHPEVKTDLRDSVGLDHLPNNPSSILEAANLSKIWIENITSQKPEAAVNVGIDVEELEGFSSDNKIFIDRNFTDAEQLFAYSSVDPHSTLAGMWSAKEAVFKSLGTTSKGAGAPLKDIEILSDNGIPIVKLHGDALTVARENGIQDFKISLSHDSKTAMAVALALYGDGEPTY